jgi:hypothetical protein
MVDEGLSLHRAAGFRGGKKPAARRPDRKRPLTLSPQSGLQKIRNFAIIPVRDVIPRGAIEADRTIRGSSGGGRRIVDSGVRGAMQIFSRPCLATH